MARHWLQVPAGLCSQHGFTAFTSQQAAELLLGQTSNLRLPGCCTGPTQPASHRAGTERNLITDLIISD